MFQQKVLALGKGLDNSPQDEGSPAFPREAESDFLFVRT